MIRRPTSRRRINSSGNHNGAILTSAPTREPATQRITRASMRAYARVALVSMAVPASFGLAGCAAIDELKETFLRWVESEKPPSGRTSCQTRPL
jgi:hypothetical protein